MVIIRGVNAFPSVVAAAVNTCAELNGEYLIRLKHPPPYDRLPLEVEIAGKYEYDDRLREKISNELSASLRLSIDLTLLSPGQLGRTEGKTRRLIREYNV